MKITTIHEPTLEELQKATKRNMINPIYYENECWKDIDDSVIEGINPWYMISTYGRIYSKVTKHILRTTIINSGYEKICLYARDGRKIDALVHRLVLMTFNPVEGMKDLEVNHIDTIKTNNRLYNLEWVTGSENMYHANRNNLYKNCEDHMWSKLTNDDVHNICKAIVQGISDKDIINMYNLPVKEHTIRLIRKGVNWKNITREYNLCD